MAGRLIPIQSVEVTSAVSHIDLGGVNWDSSFDVYKLVINGMSVTINGDSPYARILDSSNNPISTSTYKFAQKIIFGATAVATGGSNTFTYLPLANNIMTNNDTFSSNAIWYLYNFNSISEPSYVVYSNAHRRTTNNELVGFQGGGMLPADAHKGVRIYAGTTLASGKATLYGVA